MMTFSFRSSVKLVILMLGLSQLAVCATDNIADGFTCTDLDECILGTDTCDANATCTNTVGSYTCACNTGYTGDGFTCTAIDPYLGCYINANRDLSVDFLHSPDSMSLEMCTQNCQGFDYLSLMHGQLCRCGNKYGRFGSAAEGECNIACFGEPDRMCGGTWRLSVYSTADNVYQGCYIDRDAHTLTGPFVKSTTDMSLDVCIELCQGYDYLALLYGQTCRCGNDDYTWYGSAPEEECDMACTGEEDRMCGGFWRQSVYQYSLLQA